MYEMPPILQGSEREQLRALRDYLVRMALSLEQTGSSTESEKAVVLVKQITQNAERSQAEAARARAAQLRSLIIKTADTIQQNVDRITQSLHEDYLAISDFGAYQENINTTIEQTARNIVESYDFEASIQAVNDRYDEADSYLTAIRGEIRRGLITDPETGETAMGIAISENLNFTGVEQNENGVTYYELSPGQTLGLYTATGWQFWINGSKRGWFDSVDGMLHVANLAVENELYLGSGWILTTADGFGLRYRG